MEDRKGEMEDQCLDIIMEGEGVKRWSNLEIDDQFEEE